MKISKVDHTKTGVGITAKQTKGILYSTSKPNLDIEKHIMKLNERAQRLYSIFITIPPNNNSSAKPGRPPQTTERLPEEIKEFSLDLRECVLTKCYNPNPDGISPTQLNALEQLIKEYTTSKKIKAANIDDIVDAYLRNSLRKYVKTNDTEQKIYVPELIKKLLKNIAPAKSAQTKPLSPTEKKALLKVLNEDYSKNAQMKKIVRSIESQNVRVKRVEKDGKILLQLSNAEHKQKKYVFAFLTEFAASEHEKQLQMLVHFKQLILLFYCGKNKYEDALALGDKMPVWNWGILQEDSIVNFDDEIYHMIVETSSETSCKKRKVCESITQKVQEKITEHYRNAVKTKGLTEADIFWIQYIENSAQKLLLSKKGLSPIKLSVSYLCEHTFREWTSYVCMKYIEMGKGVYHFTVPKNINKVISGETVIGQVLPEYKDGITSFDYERIKAEETLSRDLSLYIAFAINNFAMSVLDSETRKGANYEDILSINETDLLNNVDDDADRKILRFWGGKSLWTNGKPDDISLKELVLAIREALQSVRNCNFHYTSGMTITPGEHSTVLEYLFQKEFKDTGSLYGKKFSSNNAWMFYTEKNIVELLNVLYHNEQERPAQIPSFHKVMNKADLEEFMNDFILTKEKLLSAENSLECIEKFRGFLLFALKEIYYYGFLQDANLKKYFNDAVKKNTNQNSNPKDKQQAAAHQNFKLYLDGIHRNNPKITFGEICQQIMTDYNLQNQGNHCVTSNKKGHDDEKYKHFRALLYLYIKKAFINYLKEQECYHFLRKPENIERSTPVSFCSGWQPHLYDNLKREAEEDRALLVWYAMAHFLNRKQLNKLIGCINNYMQYVQDINRRCQNTRHRTDKTVTEAIRQYKRILSVLSFSMLFCGNTTNCFEDYFRDEDDYTAHLAAYIDFDGKDTVALKAFCSHPADGSPTGTIGLYYDGLNPVMNKNIVYASMYGNEKLFQNCYQKITQEQIMEYYQSKNALAQVFKKGICKDKKEEETLRKFQNQKNHIELTDITTYSEIVNELTGQLISWAYLRERDLMYYQLGIHYIRLYYSDCIEKDSPLRKLNGEGISIPDGALLYQIIAMYTYHLPVYVFDKKGQIQKEEKSPSNGASVKAFYRNYCRDNGEIYNWGLCLFENTEKEHDEIINFRNYIDHFKYYSHLDRSIMDLYSDVYDRFFTYEVKLRKSVSFIFSNILLRYFVIAKTTMRLGESVRYTKNNNEIKKRAARLSIKYLESDVFHLSRNNGINQKGASAKKNLTVSARDKIFLTQLQKILEYKE